MRLEPTEDEQAVGEVFAGFFANESTPEVVRAAEPLGHDAALWAKLVQTGAPGMAVDESLGGGGASLADLAIVAAAAGTHLAPVPLVEHFVAARLLARVAPDHEANAAAIAGDSIATVAFVPASGGVARLCPAGAVADIVMALDGDDLVVAISPAPGEGPATTSASPLADRSLSGATVVASAASAHEHLRTARAEWNALTAVYATALGRQALQLGVDYVMERHQFDVPVGSFQAVQHGLAGASVSIEGATLLSNKAIWAVETGSTELAAMAYLFCTETAQTAAAVALQYHGGYGFAEEYDIQMYYRRAKGLSLLVGSPGAHYQDLADALLGPVS